MTLTSLPTGSRFASVSPQAKVAASAIAFLGLSWSADAAIVGQWVADNYTTGNWTDSSGGNHTATAVGTFTTTNVGFNGHKGINFLGGDGAASSGYFTVVNDATLLSGATAFTLAAVFNPAAANTSVGGQFWQKAGLIGNEQAGAVPDWGLGFGALQADVGVGGPDTTILSGDLTLLTPHIAVATWSTSGTMTLYVDGVQVAQTLTAPTAARTALGFPVALGASVGTQNGDLHIFNGQIAELRIYNDVQDPATLYNSLRTTYIVPEPGVSMLVTVGALGLIRRRRSG